MTDVKMGNDKVDRWYDVEGRHTAIAGMQLKFFTDSSVLCFLTFYSLTFGLGVPCLLVIQLPKSTDRCPFTRAKMHGPPDYSHESLPKPHFLTVCNASFECGVLRIIRRRGSCTDTWQRSNLYSPLWKSSYIVIQTIPVSVPVFEKRIYASVLHILNP